MVDIPQSILLPIDQLTVDGQNPNQMTDRQHKALASSIEKYGFIIPIITNQDYLIADGEQRLTVAKSLGMTEVPVIALPVQDIDRRLLRQVLNKLRGEHQHDLDVQEFLRIVEAGERQQLQDLILINDVQLDRHLIPLKNVEEVALPSLDKYEVSIERGQIFQLNRHLLMCGDATHTPDVDQLCLQPVNMVFTDPPYSSFGSSEGFAKNIVDDKMIRPFIRSMLFNIRSHLVVSGQVYIFTDWKTYPAFHDENKYVGLTPRNLIVWSKRNARLGSMYAMSYELIWFLDNIPDLQRMTQKSHSRKVYGETNVWDIPTNTTAERSINTEKPLILSSRAINNSSDVNDVVLDLFGGGGNTLLACEQLNRICYMMEIDPYYCQVIINRWEHYTGDKAQQLN